MVISGVLLSDRMYSNPKQVCDKRKAGSQSKGGSKHKVLFEKDQKSRKKVQLQPFYDNDVNTAGSLDRPVRS